MSVPQSSDSLVVLVQRNTVTRQLVACEQQAKLVLQLLAGSQSDPSVCTRAGGGRQKRPREQHDATVDKTSDDTAGTA